jgi:hypothetical protein
MNLLELLYDYRWLVLGVLAFFILNARCSDRSLRELEYRLDGLEDRLGNAEDDIRDLEWDIWQ